MSSTEGLGCLTLKLGHKRPISYTGESSALLLFFKKKKKKKSVILPFPGDLVFVVIKWIIILQEANIRVFR